MNRKITILVFFLIFAISGKSQSFNWVTGGGSTEGMSIDDYERVTSMCTDNDGNIYVIAYVGATSIMADTFYLALAHDTYSSITHLLLSSYRRDGTMRWAKLIESSNSTSTDNDGYSNGGIAYCNGSIYLAGAFNGGELYQYFGYDTVIFDNYAVSFTVRYDTSGQFKWIKFIGPDSSNTPLLANQPGVIAVDGEGNLHNFDVINPGVQLTPLVRSDTTGTYDLKYDSLGNLLSATRVHLDSVWQIMKVVFDKNDGKFYAILQPNQMYWWTYYSNNNSALCVFGPDERIIWMDTTGSGNIVNSLDYKGGNDIYVCGTSNYPDTFNFGGLSVTDTIFPMHNLAVVCRLDTNGVAKWIYNLQSNQALDGFGDITILPGGRIATSGAGGLISINGRDTLTTPVGEYTNPYILILDSSGVTIKLDQWYGDGGYDYGICIASDTVGNVYVGGEIVDTIGGHGLIAYHSHGGNSDFFIGKYGYPVTCTSPPVVSFSDTGGSRVVGFSYTGTTAGVDSIVWSFGDGSGDTGMAPVHTYADTGWEEVCVTVYTPLCGSSALCYYIHVVLPMIPTGVTNLAGWAQTMGLFPNPAQNQVTISYNYGTAANGADRRIVLYDIYGQVAGEQAVNNQTGVCTLQLTGVAAGSYLVRMEESGHTVQVQHLAVTH